MKTPIGIVGWAAIIATAAGAITCAVAGVPALSSRIEIDFGKNGVGAQPAGFDFRSSGAGAPGDWVVVRDKSTGRLAIDQLSPDRTEQRFPLAIYRELSLRNVEVSVRLKPISGRIDLAGGVAVRLQTPDDYYVVGADAYDDEVAFFRVRHGKPEKIVGAAADLGSMGWHTLDVRADDNHFIVHLDGRWLFTAYDGALEAGQVALWTKADSIVRFSEIEVTPLPWSERR